MTNSAARHRFQKADWYYLEERYEEALALLEELDEAFPNTKNIIWPKARCMAKLGRKSEATALCNYLLNILHDDRAAHLLEKMADGERKSSQLRPRLAQSNEGLRKSSSLPPPLPEEKAKGPSRLKAWLGGFH